MISYGMVFSSKGPTEAQKWPVRGGTAIRCSRQSTLFTGRGGVWLKLVIGRWHRANSQAAQYHPRKSTVQGTTNFNICLTRNNYHFQSTLVNVNMAGKFEPKEPVQLNPPKSDPISQDELSKATGKFQHTLAYGSCHTLTFMRAKLGAQIFP